MPNATARGGNAFSVMHTAPPIPLNNTLDSPTIVDETSTNNSAGTDALINPMDIDQHDSNTTSVFTSNSFGKCKLDVIASDEELAQVQSTCFCGPSHCMAYTSPPFFLPSIKIAYKSKKNWPIFTTL